MINREWKRILHPKVSSGYYINEFGEVYNENSPDVIMIPSYHSSNGYDFILLINNDMKTQLFPIDDLVALTFIPIPNNLIGKKVKVNHIDGDTRNSYVSNLEWIEDIEEWKEIDLPFISSKGYFVSSWGRIRNPDNELICEPIKNMYKTIWFRDNNHHRKKFVMHRIQAAVFGILDDYYSSFDINHIDGIKYNNYWKNIEKVTRKDNNKHAILTDLRTNHLTNHEQVIVANILKEMRGGIRQTLKYIIENKSVDINKISETVIIDIKKKMKDQGYVFDINYVTKMDQHMHSEIEDLLIRYQGNTAVVYQIIHNKYPDLSRGNIGYIRNQLQKRGYSFKDYKLNRKISEVERKELIDLLCDNKWNIAKSYRIVSNIPKFQHVSVYDLKYLKRKYGV